MKYIENVNLIQKLRKFGYKSRHSEFISEDTLYDVFDWLINEHHILPLIFSHSHKKWDYRITGVGYRSYEIKTGFNSYDDALEAAICESLNILLNEKI